MEFATTDIFQHSPFGDILNLLKSLSLSGEPWPDYGQDSWDADDEEIRSPPTTHFVATVESLNDMLDFDSEDIDGMDADKGDDQEPAPIGLRKTTSSYDVCMVDTYNRNNNEDQKDAARDRSPEKQSKRRHKRKVKPHLDKDPAIKQGESMEDKHAIEQPSKQGGQSEQPILGKDNSPDDLTPDKLLEHQNLHQRLVATARSLKKQKWRLKRNMHSGSDGAKYPIPHTSTAVVATQRAIRSENYCRNLMRRP